MSCADVNVVTQRPRGTVRRQTVLGSRKTCGPFEVRASQIQNETPPFQFREDTVALLNPLGDAKLVKPHERVSTPLELHISQHNRTNITVISTTDGMVVNVARTALGNNLAPRFVSEAMGVQSNSQHHGIHSIVDARSCESIVPGLNKATKNTPTIIFLVGITESLTRLGRRRRSKHDGHAVFFLKKKIKA